MTKLMNLVFFIQSKTVNLQKFTIKDLPGSSGRFDVICRCILSAIYNDYNLEKSVQIWVFLPQYGTFIFNSRNLNPQNFPKNELLLAKKFSNFILQINQELKIQKNNMTIFEAINEFIEKNYKIIVLSEKGRSFESFLKDPHDFNDLLCIIGDQTGDLLESIDLNNFSMQFLSFGAKSYLASSVIRLVKIALMNSRKNFKF
ncbi:MAG: hypothetical protein EU532_12385 [Promethearchaeota archaeon]|nr:MAG: hypothetical protein EU532_12385 [Candidatus Lokiarchaeota archaeon]